MKPINWEISAQDGKARTGRIKTRRSEIETPVFMPVGTQGTLKGVRFEWLEDEMDARIILGNTYHLWLRPGTEIIRKLGGLHKFSSWNRSLLTDSGGFQVFSLSDRLKLNEDGVEFRSHIDGTKMFMSPEVSMEVQAALGAEIAMVFDECPPGDAGHEATKKSLELTARWALRSKERFGELQDQGMDTGFVDRAIDHPGAEAPPLLRKEGSRSELSGRQALFGIIQGAGHLDLREESLNRTVDIGFDGYAIGGLSVGEEKSVMYEVLDFLAHKIPLDSPRYLMGVGTPEDLIEAVYQGIDMFDCVMPTRNGRTGGAFTSRGKINIRNAKFAADARPLDEDCDCSVCSRYSRGYLRHLYLAKEMLAATMISHHNLSYFLGLMKEIRAAISDGDYDTFRKDRLSALAAG
ncbi:MAG: tRNA guanosine(34) transglycosylase Tgt [Pyrinomonadaceae bacterium]|nr:tRNA guanosine(34) transglycosylase Tgt [Pyrinomonadaceae bacterium]